MSKDLHQPISKTKFNQLVTELMRYIWIEENNYNAIEALNLHKKDGKTNPDVLHECYRFIHENSCETRKALFPYSIQFESLYVILLQVYDKQDLRYRANNIIKHLYGKNYSLNNRNSMVQPTGRSDTIPIEQLIILTFFLVASVSQQISEIPESIQHDNEFMLQECFNALFSLTKSNNSFSPAYFDCLHKVIKEEMKNNKNRNELIDTVDFNLKDYNNPKHFYFEQCVRTMSFSVNVEKFASDIDISLFHQVFMYLKAEYIKYIFQREEKINKWQFMGLISEACGKHYLFSTKEKFWETDVNGYFEDERAIKLMLLDPIADIFSLNDKHIKKHLNKFNQEELSEIHAHTVRAILLSTQSKEEQDVVLSDYGIENDGKLDTSINRYLKAQLFMRASLTEYNSLANSEYRTVSAYLPKVCASYSDVHSHLMNKVSDINYTCGILDVADRESDEVISESDISKFGIQNILFSELYTKYLECLEKKSPAIEKTRGVMPKFDLFKAFSAEYLMKYFYATIALYDFIEKHEYEPGGHDQELYDMAEALSEKLAKTKATDNLNTFIDDTTFNICKRYIVESVDIIPFPRGLLMDMHTHIGQDVSVDKDGVIGHILNQSGHGGFFLRKLDDYGANLLSTGKTYTNSEIKNALNNKFPHFKEVTEIVCNELNENYFKPLFIVGDSGIGKSYYLSELARLTGFGTHTENIPSITLNSELVGSHPQFQSASYGSVYNVSTKNAKSLFILDKIDKAEYTHNHERHVVLTRLLNYVLDKENLHKFKDSFAKKPIDISNIMFFATAEDTKNIPQEVLSHLRVVKVKTPSPQENIKIIRNIWHDIEKSDKLNKKIDSALCLKEYADGFTVAFYRTAIHMSYKQLQSMFVDLVKHIDGKNMDWNEIKENWMSLYEEHRDSLFASLNKNFSVLTPHKIKRGFDKIYGNFEVKSYLMDMIEIYKNKLVNIEDNNPLMKHVAEKLKINTSANVVIPDQLKGLVMFGEPGVGKTMFAGAFAQSCGVPFISLSGNSFKDKYVGEGRKRVKELFDFIRNEAKQSCVLFIDEIDALGARTEDKRDDGVINELLVQLDGIENKSDISIFVVAATNFKNKLDAALTRSGRFDRSVHVALPNFDERVDIIDNMLSEPEYQNFKGIDSKRIARLTHGKSGADIRNILNSAIVLAIRQKQDVTQSVVDEAIEELSLGFKTRKESEEDMRMTAYHEAGHACMSYLLNVPNKVTKVTVTPRNKALGITFITPEEEYKNETQQQMLNDIIVLFGGTCAEKHFFNKETTGASSDIRMITQTANNMVRHYGFIVHDEALKDSGINFDEMKLSDTVKTMLDMEVINIVRGQKKRCLELMIKYENFIKDVAEELFNKEVITNTEIDLIAQKHGVKSSMLNS